MIKYLTPEQYITNLKERIKNKEKEAGELNIAAVLGQNYSGQKLIMKNKE